MLVLAWSINTSRSLADARWDTASEALQNKLGHDAVD